MAAENTLLPTNSAARLARIRASIQTHRRLRRLTAVDKQAIAKHLTMSAAARRVHLSPSRFVHVFSSTTGSTFTAWLQLERLALATPLVAASELSLSLVAEECGFGTCRTMQRTFNGYFGMTPRRFRKLYAERGADIQHHLSQM